MKLRCLCLWIVVGALTFVIPPAAGAAAGNKSLMAAGQNRTIVIQKDGSLWACGDNDSGALGLGDTITRDILTRVGTANNWTAIAHHTHALALRADGTLWAWGGDNSHGQYGLGNTTPLHIPTQVGGNTDWVAVSVGTFHSLALKNNGTLWAWGDNSSGQLGAGVGDQYSPMQVGSDTHWVAVVAGGWHSLGLKDDGSLWAWGNNSNGQLGLGEVGSKNSPTKVGDGWVAIASGELYSLGLKADGSLYAWGYNNYGQLGVGGTDDRNIPTLVGTGWVAVSGGFWPDYHSLGLKADGSLWAWGYNGEGQLGLGVGDTANRSLPTHVGSEVNWVAVAAGGSYSLGLKADGSLWAWGQGGNELGLGDPGPNRFVPTKVPRFNAPKVVVIPLN